MAHKQNSEEIRRNLIDNLSWWAAERDDCQNVAAMTSLGFNAHQIANGFTRRGDHRRKGKPKQGPISPQALTQSLAKLSAETVMTFFDGCVAALAAFGVFAEEITVAVDGSKIETTEKYQGRGRLRVEKRKRDEEGKWVTLVEYLFGWKIVVSMDTRTRIPLALEVLKIEAYEGEWLVPLVERARSNLGQHARIGCIQNLGE